MKVIKKALKIVVILAVVLIVGFIALMFISPDSKNASTTKSEKTTASQTEDESKSVLFEDNFIKATYEKLFTASSVDGVVYLQLKVENKSEKTITVSLSNAAVNGMSTTIGSGVPMDILPGNSSKQPFIIFTTNTDVEKVDDIEKIQFSFFLMDEHAKKIEETKVIDLNIK